MNEPVQIKVNGRGIRVTSSTVVAAAIAQAGISSFRRSVLAAPRGPLCGMGICMECRVTINGQAHCRSCLTLCEEGMEVRTDDWSEGRASRGPVTTGFEGLAELGLPRKMSERNLDFEVVVVGAGPAGLAAACTAAECGCRVALMDETPWLGGQIWRGQQARPASSVARFWFDKLQRSGATLISSATVIGFPAEGVLLAELNTGPVQVKWQRLVLATGARELFLPFPGWTLPGVVGPGGLQTLIKNGWPVAGRRAVVAGSGPLLLVVADTLRKQGARVIIIAEQAPQKHVVGFGIRLGAHPAKLWQAANLRVRLLGTPYQFGVWPVRAEGADTIRSVTLTDGTRTWTDDCDILACGFGVVPNVELALALGCNLNGDYVQVDNHQTTTVPGVFCAGEPTGIGGADCALVEGQIAGYAAAGQKTDAETLFARRASWHKFRASLAEAFALRPELKTIAADDTLLCRCEDVALGRVNQFSNWRAAKLQSRCGMGACQGRVCGAASKFLLGWGMESVRPPLLPARVESLIVTANAR